jgi:hypothetical protein
MPLRKNPQLVVSSENPFEHDCLNRERPALHLTTLLESASQPFVLAVQAPWGWGKTTFIDMWKHYLSKRGFSCLHFNAWECDFVEDPLLAFLGEMGGLVQSELSDVGQNSPIWKDWQEMRRLGGQIAAAAAPTIIQAASLGGIDSSLWERVTSLWRREQRRRRAYDADFAAQRLANYDAQRKGMERFRDRLGNLAEAVASRSSPKRPLVFFIDELDRCRPDFAVRLLERMKHLFLVENVVFVLALDASQLSHSVKCLYGADMDADGYLRRFIDLSYRLPEPEPRPFAELLFRRFSLAEALKRRGDGVPWSEDVVEAFATLSSAFALSLRKQEQCFTEINLVVRTAPLQTKLYYPILLYLAALRASDAELYDTLGGRKADLKPYLEPLRATQRHDLYGCIEAALAAGCLGQTNAANLRNDRRQEANRSKKGNPRAERTATLLELPDFLSDENIVRRHMRYLEIAGDFDKSLLGTDAAKPN